MEPDFWRARWAEGRIGFHEGRPNATLAEHVGRLAQAQRVLVPLCGKSEDLAFLAAAGHAVVGVELVEDAARAFFTEHDLTPELSEHGALKCFRVESIAIWVGDFFDTRQAALGTLTAFYDRAALVALPEALRPRYVQHLRTLCQPGAKGLVLSYEYEPAAFQGPPFAILEDELRGLYAGAEVTPLTPPRPAHAPRFAEQGVSLHERLYEVVLSAPAQGELS